ncbi:MAG TPA: hypothetical protein VKZ51_09210 [Cyclobacteriaceae bacterium]|nr:hypothetical protein [Cyclobacteriaceae bacterium]
MEVFGEFYGSLLPYLLFIPLGFWIGKKQWLTKNWITGPLIYVLMPVLVINHVLKADEVKLTLLPIMAFLLAAAMVIPAKLCHHYISRSDDPLILKSAFSYFNVAFFGIPIVTALFGAEMVTTLICIYLGTALYGNTVGFYQIAKSKYSAQKAIFKVLKIPFLYIFLLALVLKIWGAETPKPLAPLVDVISVVVSAGGMMMVGMNVVKVDFTGIDKRYFIKTLSFRTTSALLIVTLLIALEYVFMDDLDPKDRNILLLVALFPVAANLTVYASFLGSKEEASALIVLLTMGLSLILVPLAAMWF